MAIAINGYAKIANAGAGRLIMPQDLGVSLESAGWRATTLPLGESEGISSIVKVTLDFDWYLFKKYSCGDVNFSLYVVGWSAGRVPPHLVESHTPDHCWLQNGWRCLAAKEGFVAPGAGAVLAGGSWRLFSDPGDVPVNVAFWHYVGEEAHNYGKRNTVAQNAYYWLKDAFLVGKFAGKRQLFVRISSCSPLEEILAKSEVQFLVDQLAGLVREKPGM